jgi:hypothetical protein
MIEIFFGSILGLQLLAILFVVRWSDAWLGRVWPSASHVENVKIAEVGG